MALAKAVALIVVLGTVLAGSPACRAQAPAPELRHDMPVQPDALTQVEFDAIVAEAREVSRATNETHDTRHWPARWQHLDRARLAAWWRMPRSADVDEPVRITLVEQAAVWDMLAFERPSEAAALWQRLWPRQPAAKVAGNPNSTGWTFDDQWSDRATALLTLFQCYPQSAWMADGDASVWVVQNRKSWYGDWGAASPWDNFHQCITATTTSRAAAVSDVLADLFTRELLRDGCSRDGPDSCLAVYGALYSLDHHNPRLPKLLQRLEPSFDLQTPLAMPAEPAQPPADADAASDGAIAKQRLKKPRRARQAVDGDPLLAVDAELERRLVFVTAKLPVLLDRPDAWRAGELERTLNRALDLSLLARQLDRQANWRARRGPRYFDTPWQWIDARTAARTDAILMAAGAAHARSIACDQREAALFGLPAAFRRGYTIENIRLGRTACSDPADLQLADIFRAVALDKDAEAARREAAVFSPIADALARDGAVRTAALDAVAPFCDASTHDRLRDPWQLCDGVTRREVAQAVVAYQAEQARLADIERQRREAESRRDPGECPPDTVWHAAQALGYRGDADFWHGTQSACRLRPEDREQAIVALTYFEGDQRTGVASDPQDDPGVSLDVLVVRVADGSLVARAQPGGHVDSDAIRFDGIAIDTANYALAPGVRAFGVRIAHGSSCSQCMFGTTDLTLFVQRGPDLAPVLDLTIGESRGEVDSSDCGDQPSHMSRTLRVGAGSSHGYADLSLRTSTLVKAEDLSDACKKTLKATSLATQTLLRFDGERYQATDGTTLSAP